MPGALTTENNMSPTQLFACGYLFTGDPSTTPRSEVPDTANQHVTANLGVESVEIPPTVYPMTNQQSRELLLVLAAHQRDCDYFIEIYKTVRNFIYSLPKLQHNFERLYFIL